MADLTIDKIYNDDFTVLDAKIKELSRIAYRHYKDNDLSKEYQQLYSDILDFRKSNYNRWNLERLNADYVDQLQKMDKLEYLFNFRAYYLYGKFWIKVNSPLYREMDDNQALELLYIIRLYRQFKAMAEYQFIIDLANYYPNAQISSNQLLDTMHAIDFIAVNRKGYTTYLTYVHIAEQGQEQSIQKKKQGTGVYRYSDGIQFIHDKYIRPSLKDIPNHKHIFFTIGKDGFVFDKSQFDNLFDTNILYSRLRELISDHRNKQTKINLEDTEKVIRKWQSVTELKNKLI